MTNDNEILCNELEDILNLVNEMPLVSWRLIGNSTLDTEFFIESPEKYKKYGIDDAISFRQIIKEISKILKKSRVDLIDDLDDKSNLRRDQIFAVHHTIFDSCLFIMDEIYMPARQNIFWCHVVNSIHPSIFHILFFIIEGKLGKDDDIREFLTLLATEYEPFDTDSVLRGEEYEKVYKRFQELRRHIMNS